MYHKNIFNILKPKWIEKCIQSILSQTFQHFEILELNYGNDKTKLMELWSIKPKQIIHYFQEELDNHSYAMNYLLDKAFLEMNFDIIFNVHLDDFYHPQRFEIQLKAFEDNTIDLVSSNHIYIREDLYGNDMIELLLDTEIYGKTQEDIKKSFENEHNLIAHPVVAFNKSFWRKHKDICYYSETPVEDFKLWLRCIQYNDIKFKLLPEYLLYYRQHNNQTSKLEFNGDALAQCDIRRTRFNKSNDLYLVTYKHKFSNIKYITF